MGFDCVGIVDDWFYTIPIKFVFAYIWGYMVVFAVRITRDILVIPARFFGFID